MTGFKLSMSYQYAGDLRTSASCTTAATNDNMGLCWPIKRVRYYGVPPGSRGPRVRQAVRRDMLRELVVLRLRPISPA